jgi:hypothetical protein
MAAIIGAVDLVLVGRYVAMLPQMRPCGLDVAWLGELRRDLAGAVRLAGLSEALGVVARVAINGKLLAGDGGELLVAHGELP